MADKLGLGPDVRELKLGSSFTNPKGLAFHTLRYDFKPASVDMNQMGALDVGANGQVTVTVPPNNVFKGSVKPYQKQCVVVINMDTKEITLERLTSNIQVKKTRSERPPSSMPPTLPTLDQLVSQKGRKPGSHSNNRGSKGAPGKTGGKIKSHHLAAASLSSVVPKHSPLHASPNRKSPNSTTRLSPNGPNSHNVASLSMIDLDDNFSESMFASNEMARDRSLPHNARRNPPPPPPPPQVDRSRPNKPEREVPRFERMEVVDRPPKPPALEIVENGVGVLSDSSSSSSSDSSDSSDTSDNEEPQSLPPPRLEAARAHTNSGRAPQAPHTVLREDLQLSSESGDDSD